MRSVRMKLVLIMVLLIIALMTVVGSILINGVGMYFINDFYSKMQQTFSQEFINRLNATADQGAKNLKELLMGQTDLGVDFVNRNVYVLDMTARYIDGSADEATLGPEVTANMLTACNGEVGQESAIVASYMDLAVPVKGDNSSYIVYVRDNKRTVNELNSQLLLIIMQALALGLVICVMLSFMLAEILINPIEKLTQGVKNIAAGNYSAKLSVPSRDEIGTLTANFNYMGQVLKSTLEEIENERDKLSTLFLHMSDGVVAFNRSGEVIHYNPAAERMLRQELAGCDYDGLFGDIASKSDLLVLEKPEFIESRKKAGQSDLEFYLAPFSAGETGGVLVVIHDITEQIRAEELRRELVANVSHELRTPLTNIKSYAETIVESGSGLPEDTRESFMNVILGETDRMTRIVADLLTLSRFDYGKMEMNMTSFPIAEAVKSACEAVSIDAKNHGHTLELALANDLPKIRADRERIVQVLLNVLSNAIKYTPDGGLIRLKAENGDSNVVIRVSDNGIGIPEKDLPRLFERFYRVDKARSRESGGTGLGLSIAREIIAQHNGEITLESKQGEGTTITLTLPLEPTQGGEV